VSATDAVLALVALLGGSVWVGGFVAIVVVTRIARSTLGPGEQVAFFQALGRGWGLVSAPALALALAGGGALMARDGWGAGAGAAALVAAALLVCTAAGVLQARGMTRLRRRALHEDDDGALGDAVRRGAARARVLRGLIGALSLALVALASALAT